MRREEYEATLARLKQEENGQAVEEFLDREFISQLFDCHCSDL